MRSRTLRGLLGLVLLALLPSRTAFAAQDISPAGPPQPTRLVGGLERREMIATQMGPTTPSSLTAFSTIDLAHAPPASDFRQRIRRKVHRDRTDRSAHRVQPRRSLHGVTATTPSLRSGRFQRGATGFSAPTIDSCGRSTPSLDSRTACFRNESVGADGGCLRLGRHQQSSVGRHLERTRQSKRHRGRSRSDTVPHAELQPHGDTWGKFPEDRPRKNRKPWMGWARNQGLRRMTNAGCSVV